MNLPTPVTLYDGDARLPEEGWYLHGYDANGESAKVEVRQRNIPTLEYAGLLFVNGGLVKARTEEETAVLALLNAAEFAEEPRGSVDHLPGPITGAASLRRIRDLIVAWIRSDEYLEIARHGVKQKFVPWRRY